MKHIQLESIKALREFMGISDLEGLFIVYLGTLNNAAVDAEKIKGDGVAFKKLAHKMKSSSASLGALKLAEISEKLEQDTALSFIGHALYLEWIAEMAFVKVEIQGLLDSHFEALEAKR